MDWPSTVLASAVAGIAAYFGSYLRMKGELRAVRETLDTTTRIQAEINEAMRVKWSRRCDIIAELYGMLNDVDWKCRRRTTGGWATGEQMEDLRESRQQFDGHFLRSVVFLPERIEQQFDRISLDLLDVVSGLGRSPNELDDSVPQRNEETSRHMKARDESRPRLIGGDIEEAMKRLKVDLRTLLEGKD